MKGTYVVSVAVGVLLELILSDSVLGGNIGLWFCIGAETSCHSVSTTHREVATESL